MKLIVVGPNQTELILRNGTKILFSYQTPVVVERDGELFKTDKKWGATTGKHISKYLDARVAEEISQEKLEDFANEL